MRSYRAEILTIDLPRSNVFFGVTLYYNIRYWLLSRVLRLSSPAVLVRTVFTGPDQQLLNDNSNQSFAFNISNLIPIIAGFRNDKYFDSCLLQPVLGFKLKIVIWCFIFIYHVGINFQLQTVRWRQADRMYLHSTLLTNWCRRISGGLWLHVLLSLPHHHEEEVDQKRSPIIEKLKYTEIKTWDLSISRGTDDNYSYEAKIPDQRFVPQIN